MPQPCRTAFSCVPPGTAISERDSRRALLGLEVAEEVDKPKVARLQCDNDDRPAGGIHLFLAHAYEDCHFGDGHLSANQLDCPICGNPAQLVGYAVVVLLLPIEGG